MVDGLQGSVYFALRTWMEKLGIFCNTLYQYHYDVKY